MSSSFLSVQHVINQPTLPIFNLDIPTNIRQSKNEKRIIKLQIYFYKKKYSLLWKKLGRRYESWDNHSKNGEHLFLFMQHTI